FSLLMTGQPGPGRPWQLLPYYLTHLGDRVTDRLQWSARTPWFGALPSRVYFAEDRLPGNTDGPEPEYCQTYGELGEVGQWPHSPEDAEFGLPDRARRLPASEWVFDDTQVGSSGLRRITYKAPAPRFFWKRPASAESPPARVGRAGPSQAAFYVQI